MRKPASQTPRPPNRLELAEMARALMPEAMKKLVSILHETGSDLAALQAFRALKDTAYGKEPPEISVAMEFESLTDEELKTAIESELSAGDPTTSRNAEYVAVPPPEAQLN